MRKLMLISAIAFMASTPCYANLSLANADTAPNATGQPKTTADARPVTTAGSAERISRRRQHHRTASRFTNHYYGFFDRSYGYSGGGC
jgi:hypothetical protein